jgi:hypothetical protein
MPDAASALEVMEREFLQIRCRLLDLAAMLDRVSRAGLPADDRRWQQIQEALRSLGDTSADHAERVQMAFSLPYDELWRQTLGV